MSKDKKETLLHYQQLLKLAEAERYVWTPDDDERFKKWDDVWGEAR